MNLIKCSVGQNKIAEDNGTGWLKVQLPGIKEKHYIYIKEYICECGNKSYVSTDTDGENIAP